MKERRQLVDGLFFFSVGLILIDHVINYRVYGQVQGNNNVLVNLVFVGWLTKFVLSTFSFVNVKFAMVFFRLFQVIGVVIYCGHAAYVSNSVSKKTDNAFAIIGLLLFLLSVFISPIFLVSTGNFEGNYWLYGAVFGLAFILLLSYGSKVGKTFSWFEDKKGSGLGLKEDPFGKYERLFPQQTEIIETAYSVNIPFVFRYLKRGKASLKNGWINLINLFRGLLLMGTPGSGKSYGIILPIIEQLIKKDFTLINYDFKFDSLTKFAYWTYLKKLEKEKALGRKDFKYPEFSVIFLEEPLVSDRCNVFQPAMLKDFVVDVVGLIKAFFAALNPSWQNKEGDFFPESAVNLASAGVWALKNYKPKNLPKGAFCTLPHLIELICQDTEHLIRIMVATTGDLKNIVRPFQDAMEKEAFEQLSGQTGSVQLILSRLTSPKLYWLLTEDLNSKPYDLNVNSEASPKILNLANSGQNRGVNNVVLSLFIFQLFRLINTKGRRPCGIIADEATTLSFPRGTIDVLIATGRENKIATVLGIQDKSQLVRDIGKEPAESIIKMVGNVIVGSVNDDTAHMMSDRIGEIRVMKASKTKNADGSFSEQKSEVNMKAVTVADITGLSQGEMVGILADEFEHKMDKKVFYGNVKYVHPFTELKVGTVEKYNRAKQMVVKQEVMKMTTKKGLPDLPMTKFWQDKFAPYGNESLSEEMKQEIVDQTLKRNFEQVVNDIIEMKIDLLGDIMTEEKVKKAIENANDRIASGSDALKSDGFVDKALQSV